MTEIRTTWKTMPRRDRNTVILGLFGIAFMILYAVFVVIYPDPLTELVSGGPHSPPGSERGVE